MKTYGRHLFTSMLISMWFWFAPTQGFSQCSLGLGVPVFKETFGAGTSIYAPPLPPGVTDYTYLVTECPDDSQYAIVNYTSRCYDTWPTLTDHTGDPGGYFMIVNAADTAGKFFTQTINGLCPGRTYEFSAWMVNLGGELASSVKFSIETTSGTLLGTYDTGELPLTDSAQWLKYGFYFTTTTGISSVVLRMFTDPVTNQAGTGGNNFAIDDIAFTPAGPSAQIRISGFPGDTLNIPCNNSTVLSSTVGTCYMTNAYQWQISSDDMTWTDIPGATASSYSLGSTAAGTWFYRLGVAEEGAIGSVSCRTLSNTVMVVNAKFVAPKFQSLSAAICSGAYALPSGKQESTGGVYIDTLLSSLGCDSLISTVSLSVAEQPNLGKDRPICHGDTISLNPGVFTTYKWQDGSTNPVYTVTTAGTYSVTVTDSADCVFTSSVQIQGSFCGTNPIPNTFTPNGDGINDTWSIPQLQYYPGCTVLVYNRWGRLVFNSVGYAKAWDGAYAGKAVPAGTYYYIIKLQPGGAVFSGFVTVIR